MDVKIRMIFLILALAVLYVLSKALLGVTEDITAQVVEGVSGKKDTPISTSEVNLTLAQANALAKLPLKCIKSPLPYKSGIVIADSSDLAMPQEHHPAFYGCFDWHSAVHGHWSLVYLMKRFPDLADREEIISIFNNNLTPEHIATEIEYFDLNAYTSSFERTYGWAWLLKLSEELYTWNNPDAKRWFEILQPLNKAISSKYQDYLPKLVYPIRVGTHTNTAFGLGFAHDYAVTTGDAGLQNIIESRSKDFYMTDKGCPISWEPSGYDFLSPCLEEIDIMRRVLSLEEFEKWKTEFLKGIENGTVDIQPADVKDRSDGHLVHLDGVNFSRAWCLYPLSVNTPELEKIADDHYRYSIDKIVDGDYNGEHWLASFALYALKTRSERN